MISKDQVSKIELALFIAYCFFILWYTVLSREPTGRRIIVFELFWSYKKWFLGEYHGQAEAIQNIENILFFIPYGFLFPSNRKKWRRVVFCAALFSVLIELIQYTFMLGWCEVDDVISNTIGAGIGMWLFLIARNLHQKRNVQGKESEQG
ncbi:hypothetical protein GPL15_23685 [Clostridium sp. MCC353]|uniref:VanZ family protein n=1 Tax=Clostridium sp. MCC353 TaxID=2592646 RepID=UPI001C01B48E|nr:VanZ family protein [Clostridium sp. MCC353]MBT9779484.1 hypothetical protein [Clostridium sp. MCC353]